MRIEENKEIAATATMDSKLRLLKDLYDAGIDHVIVWFDGGGDSGQIESVDLFTESGDLLPLEDIRANKHLVMRRCGSEHDGERWIPVYKAMWVSFAERLDQLVSDELDATGVDWYNNDGGFGTWELTGIMSGEPKKECEIAVRVTEAVSAHWEADVPFLNNEDYTEGAP